MGKLIILRGNSGSGKTTVAKELQKKFGYNTMLISQDEIRRNILWVKDGIDTKALMQYMYLEAEVSLIGTFVLAMVVKEIIVGTTCIL